MAIYPVPFPPSFKPYGNKPSIGINESGPHPVWWILQLGSYADKDFCCHIFVWEHPYTAVREVRLEAPVIHATFCAGGGKFWVGGFGERGWCFQDISGAEGAQVLDLAAEDALASIAIDAAAWGAREVVYQDLS